MRRLILMCVLVFGTTAMAARWYCVGGGGRFGFTEFRYNADQDTGIVWTQRETMQFNEPSRTLIPRMTVQLRDAEQTDNLRRRLEVLSGPVLLGVDRETNRVIITASESHFMEAVESMIAELAPSVRDVPELRIEADFFAARIQNHIVSVYDRGSNESRQRFAIDPPAGLEISLTDADATREGFARQAILMEFLRHYPTPVIEDFMHLFNNFDQALSVAREELVPLNNTQTTRDVRRFMYLPVYTVGSSTPY